MLKQLVSKCKLDKAVGRTVETLYMTGVSLISSFIIGISLGLLLFLTSMKEICGKIKLINSIIAAIVNIFRSIPFIILIVLLIPFTKVIVGTMIGKEAALPALIIGSAPFYARMVEIGLREIDKGVIEAARSMGAKTSTIIFKVLLPESMPAIVSGITVTDDCPYRLYSNCGCYWCGRFRRLCLFRWLFKRTK